MDYRPDVVGEEAGPEGAGHVQHFKELSVVSLRRSLDVEGRSLPAGARGTVVAAYGDGVEYEAEVFEPFHVVVTVSAGHVAA